MVEQVVAYIPRQPVKLRKCYPTNKGHKESCACRLLNKYKIHKSLDIYSNWLICWPRDEIA